MMFYFWFVIDWINHKLAKLPLIRRLPWGMGRYWFCVQMHKQEDREREQAIADAKRLGYL